MNGVAASRESVFTNSGVGWTRLRACLLTLGMGEGEELVIREMKEVWF